MTLLFGVSLRGRVFARLRARHSLHEAVRYAFLAHRGRRSERRHGILKTSAGLDIIEPADLTLVSTH